MDLRDKYPEIQAVLDGESDGCIVCADCMDVLPLMPDGCCGLVFADPPYNVGLGRKPHASRQKGYTEFDDDQTIAQYADFVGRLYHLSTRLSLTVIVTPGNTNQHLWPKPLWTMAWIKTNGVTRTPLTRGQKMMHACWEPILVYGKIDEPPAHDIFNVPISMQAAARNHPCPKPLNLMSHIVGMLNSDVVLDVVCGSGTTCVAAKKLGRRWIGIELDEGYCEIARRRIASTPKPLFTEKPEQVKQTGLFTDHETPNKVQEKY